MRSTIALLFATVASVDAGICDVCLPGFPNCQTSSTVIAAGASPVTIEMCTAQDMCDAAKKVSDSLLGASQLMGTFPQVTVTCTTVATPGLGGVVGGISAAESAAMKALADAAAFDALLGSVGASGDALMNLSGDKGKVLEFTDTDSFLQKYDEMRSTGEQFILFFEGSNAETGEKWCGWCVKFGPAIEQYVIEQTNLTVLKGFVEDPKLWKGVSSHPYKAHPIIKAKGLPTLMLAQGDEILLRVEDDDDFNPQQLTQIAAGDMMANMDGDDDRRGRREGKQGMMGDMMEGDHMTMSVGGTKILIKMGATKVAAPVAAVLGAMTLW